MPHFDYRGVPDRRHAAAANDWGCENVTGGSSKYVNKIQTDPNGKVSILVATGIKTDVDGKTVTLTPMVNGNPALATNPSAGGNMGTAQRLALRFDGRRHNPAAEVPARLLPRQLIAS